uniref:Uncharacterized protein n=1 Tax=Lygus hesperus TaxID=30085 RepID=A0A146KYB2_LYGHE
MRGVIIYKPLVIPLESHLFSSDQEFYTIMSNFESATSEELTMAVEQVENEQSPTSPPQQDQGIQLETAESDPEEGPSTKRMKPCDENETDSSGTTVSIVNLTLIFLS